MISTTPTPPYYAVIFTSVKNSNETDYLEMTNHMNKLAKTQPGFLGIESAREEIGITVSYWKDVESIKRWKENSEHLLAQKIGKLKWYNHYNTRIAKVERDYEFIKK